MKRTGKKALKLTPFNPVEKLLDPAFFGKTIVACLENNDPESVIEVINTYLKFSNISKMVGQANIARSTYYYSLKQKNPTLKTLAKIMHASAVARKSIAEGERNEQN